MKWKKIIASVFAMLSISAWSKDKDKNVLTDEQKQNLIKHFGEKFTTSLEEHINDPEENVEETPEENAEQIVALQVQLTTAQEALEIAMGNISSTQVERDRLAGQVENLNKMITKLSGDSETDPPPIRIPQPNVKWDNQNKNYLGGVQSLMFKMDNDRPYNIRAYNALARQNGDVMLPVKEAGSMDYTKLNEDLGDFNRTRRNDRIQSFIQKLPNIEDIFPLQSGFQDQDVLINMFMSEFSQPENTSGTTPFDSLIKGTFEFEPEILKMFDVAFIHRFTDLKQLEKNYLAYLVRNDGSNSIKMSFIEYILSEVSKVLHNEKQNRYVNGIYVKPAANTAGASLDAADGIREWLRKKIAGFQILPFELGEWTAASIDNYVYNMCGLVPQAVRDNLPLVLYMSPDALVKYHKNREALYGVNQDYKADLMYVAEYPNIKIQTLAGLGMSKRMFITFEGNFKTYTDKVGEMLMFNLEQEHWTLKVWSQWKESVWADLVGKKYASKAAMPLDYSTQLIFCNDVDLPANYFINMGVNDTSPSVLYHKSLQSVANTQATAITDFDDAATGDEVILKCNSITNAITIAKSGKFSLLTAAWTPDLGDTLKLKKRSDGKWIEIYRSVITTDALVIADGDASPDVTAGTEFVTSANTAACAITTLDNASYDTVYTIYGGSDTNSSTIANSGNFSLTAAMTLGVGTWIKLQKAQNDKFYEIDRG